MDLQSENQTKVNSNVTLELIKSLLYPETLENSKIIGLFSDDLSFNIRDLMTCQEIKKAFESEQILFSTMENIEFLKIDKINKTFSLQFSDNFTVYSLINVPSKMKKDELIKHLALDEYPFLRIYKKCFVWMLIRDGNTSDNFEQKLLYSYFNEEKVKYEAISGKSLRESLIKRINYLKESNELKGNSNAELNNRTNNLKNDWRKKSSETEEIFKNSVKKYSKADSNQSNFSSNNYNSNNSSNNNSNFKRKRFNSDGASDERQSQENPFMQNSKFTLSNEIKFRYSINEMNEIFEFSLKNFVGKPKFLINIDEICSITKRKIINIFEENNQSKRDRANTINYQAHEFKKVLNESKKSINLPKNNRKISIKIALQNIDNIDFINYNYNSNKFSGKKYDGYNNYNSNHNQRVIKNKFDFAN